MSAYNEMSDFVVLVFIRTHENEKMYLLLKEWQRYVILCAEMIGGGGG